MPNKGHPTKIFYIQYIKQEGKDLFGSLARNKWGIKTTEMLNTCESKIYSRFTRNHLVERHNADSAN